MSTENVSNSGLINLQAANPTNKMTQSGPSEGNGQAGFEHVFAKHRDSSSATRQDSKDKPSSESVKSGVKSETGKHETPSHQAEKSVAHTEHPSEPTRTETSQAATPENEPDVVNADEIAVADVMVDVSEILAEFDDVVETASVTAALVSHMEKTVEKSEVVQVSNEQDDKPQEADDTAAALLPMAMVTDNVSDVSVENELNEFNDSVTAELEQEPVISQQTAQVNPIVVRRSNTRPDDTVVNSHMEYAVTESVEEQGQQARLPLTDVPTSSSHADALDQEEGLLTDPLLEEVNGNTTDSSTNNSVSKLISAFEQVVSETQGTTATQTVTSVKTPLAHAAFPEAMAEKAVWMVKNNVQVAQIHIDPPHLGPIAMRVTMQNDATNIVFSVQHGNVRETLENAAPKIREMFEEQGLNSVDVNVNHQEQSDGTKQGDNPHSSGVAAKTEDTEDGQVMTSQTHLNGTHGLIDYYA